MRIKVLLLIASVIACAYIITILSIGWQIYASWIAYQKTSLQTLVKRIDDELIYKNGQWDTTRYNADPYTPHPHGSSGFAEPLYIITDEGFVLERNQPVSGLLNSSDFKQILSIKEPQTIKNVTNEEWRIIAEPINNKQNTPIGVISIAHYNPKDSENIELDERLRRNLSVIKQGVRITNNVVDVTKIDIRKIDFDVSFEIVDRSNHILLNNGRMPTFIDRSYVAKEIKESPTFKVIQDSRTKEDFLVYSYAMIRNNNTVGIILLGNSLKPLYELRKQYIITSVFLSIVIIPILSLTILALLYKYADVRIRDNHTKSKLPTRLSFSPKESVIIVNEEKVSIPYATNQYELSNALFSAPHKKWELDELMEKFGETTHATNAWRKVYDAALALNKKVGFKLVEYKEKRFSLNPELLPFLETK